MHCRVISPHFSCFSPFQNSHTLHPFLSLTLLLYPPIIPGSQPLSSSTLFFSQFLLSNLLWRTSIPSRPMPMKLQIYFHLLVGPFSTSPPNCFLSKRKNIYHHGYELKSRDLSCHQARLIHQWTCQADDSPLQACSFIGRQSLCNIEADWF